VAAKIDTTRIKLAELAQFVLNRRTEDIRSELCEHLICGAIYHEGSKDGLSKEDAHSSMKKHYEVDVPTKLLNSHILSLVSKGDLISLSKDNQTLYLLSERKLAEFSSIDKDYEKLRSEVTQEFLARVKTTYPELSEQRSQEVIGVFFDIVSSIFQRYGSICSDTISGQIAEVGNLALLPDFQQISLDNVKRINDPVLRKIVKDSFRDFLVQPSKNSIYFLLAMAQSYTIAQILNLDPQLQTLERDSFSKKRLFLDTNIIVSLMCVSESSESIAEIISMTKDLGISIVYTPETQSEFLALLKYAEELHRRNPIHKKTIVKKIGPLMENPFIKSYWIESSEKRLEWSAFVARMKAFQEFLEDRFSIKIDTLRIEGIWSDVEYKELEKAVSLADYNKPENAVRHDAYHLLMIKKIREKESTDELGMNSYFLTKDHSLNIAEQITYRGGRIPSNIPIDVWAQMILPFLSPKVVTGEAANVYVKILSSKFPSLVRSIDPKDLMEIMGMWMDDPSITTELLRKTIGTNYIHQHLERIREEQEIKTSEISKVIDPIFTQVISSTREEYESKILALQQQHSQEILTLREQLSEATKTPRQRPGIHKSLFITGLSLFVALIVLAIVSCVYRYVLSDALYWVLGVCGTALVASSVFGAVVFEKFKRL